jgi:hypothetical protein
MRSLFSYETLHSRKKKSLQAKISGTMQITFRLESVKSLWAVTVPEKFYYI